MKNLITIFKLLLFSFNNFFSQKKALKLFLSSIFIPLSLHAASETCPGVNLNLVEGPNPITEPKANASANYHQLNVPSDGTLSIVFTNQSNKTSTFFVGTSCATINDIYNGTSTAVTHTVASFAVQTGDTIQLLVDDTGNNEAYTIVIDYTIASNTPNISIDPTTRSIVQGTSSVTLDVRLSEAANKDDISVTYEHNCTGSSMNTGIITFNQGDTEANLLIDTSGLTAGISCVATLSNPTGSGLQQVGTISPDSSTITVTAPPAVSVDMTINKTDSADPVAINDDFYYTIVVTNNGTDDATNIVVTDTLPSGVTYLDTTGSDAVWNCSESDGNITCSHSSTIASGGSNAIRVNVTAPSTEGTITNEANVTNDNEIDFSNNSTVEDTTIGDTSNPADLCYTNVVGDGNSCELAGYFYYAPRNPHACLAQQDIRNQNTTNTLENVIVYKLYNPDIDNGACASPDQGSCSRLDTHSISKYSSYGSAYRYDLEDIEPDKNLTIEDTDTWYSGSDVDDIILYTTYEKDGLTYSGPMSRCPGGGSNVNITDFLAQVDIVDTVVSYSAPYEGAITTKVSNKPNYTMTAVFLGDPGAPQNANTIFASPVDMTVLYYLSDNTCAETVRLNTLPGGNEPVVSIFTDGDNSATALSNSFTMAYTSDLLSKKIARFKYKALDFGKLLSDMDIDCPNASTNGSASGTVTGIPACLISNSNNSTPAERYKQVFGDEAFVRCWEAIANGEPCNSSTNAANVPEPYNTEYGCLECSLGEAPYTCSQDAFAIRPDHFDIDTTDADFPNLLRSGEDYNMTVYGHDYSVTAGTLTSGSNDYNQTGGVGGNLDLNQSRYMATGAPDDGTLFGDLVWSAWDFNMTNGISNQNGDLSQTEVAGVQYDDAGKINLRVEDREWASVDINNPNDPTPHDCSPDGAYICGDRNVTYIPHHFNVENIHLRNHRDGGFTYLSNDLNMSAHIDANISARNADDGITQNFKQGSLYYENPVSVDLNITEWLGVASRHLKGNTTHKHDIPTETLLGFGGSDVNGTHNIPWNESNATQQLMFNYTRENNQAVNPFDVNGTDINVSVKSTYADGSTPSSPAIIVGSGIGDRNATFVYGRALPNLFFYDNITTNSTNTPVSLVAYCGLGLVNCQNNGLAGIANGLLADALSHAPEWWTVERHDISLGDGNVTLTTSNGTVSPSHPSSINPTNGIDAGIVVTNSSGTPPNIVDIDFGADTNTWLIYNKDGSAVPSPFYRVRFIGTGGWTGHGKTGHVVGDDINTKKSKRLEW